MSPLAKIMDWLRPAPDTQAAADVYITLVEQSRNPFFYQSLGVPDSMDGRFDLILLHVTLTVLRLRRDDNPESHRLAQALMENFIADMDRSLREMGVGDMGVGRRVHKMADALHGRLRAYEAALQEPGNDALEAALVRNAYGTVEVKPERLIKQLADYMRTAEKTFASLSQEQIRRADFSLPAPFM